MTELLKAGWLQGARSARHWLRDGAAGAGRAVHPQATPRTT